MSTRHPPSQLRLARGESAQLWLPRKLRLVNLGGTVTLGGAPRWLGGTLFTPAWRLDGGATHELDRGGWYRLQAQAEAELVLLAPAPSMWQRLAARGQRPWARAVRLSVQR